MIIKTKYTKIQRADLHALRKHMGTANNNNNKDDDDDDDNNNNNNNNNNNVVLFAYRTT